MGASTNSRKRKSAVVEEPVIDTFPDEDGFELGLLNGEIDESGGEDEEEVDDEEDYSSDGVYGSEEGSEGEEELDSDEIPSEDDSDAGLRKLSRQFSSTTTNSKQSTEATSDDDLEPNDHVKVTTDANGNPRYVYPEIIPDYDSDDTDAGDNANTIGNIPLSFYESYPHIGYDINGKRIMRPAAGEALDALLDSIDVPKGFTGLTDPETGKPLQLSKDELQILKRIQLQEMPEEGYDPYQPTIEYFTSKTEIMPLSAAPEPKRRFIPSLHEAKRVSIGISYNNLC
jgi:ribosome biogenesis protein ERB1